MKQIRRRLSAKGLLIATFDNRLSALEFYMERGNVEETAEFLRSGKTHWLTRNKDEQFPIYSYSPSDLAKLLNKSGFEVVDLVGKTILPGRRFRQLLAEGDARRAWARVEKRLWRDPAAIGRAAHLQVAARVRGA